MQTLKNLLLAVILATALFSCDDEVGPTFTKITPRQPDESLSGAFTLKTEQSYVSNYGPETTIKVNLKGEGELNGYGDSELELIHKKVVNAGHGQIKIFEGSMTIRVNSGSELHGNYTAYGFNDQNIEEISVNIGGCTGTFRGAHGTVKIRLIQRFGGKIEAGLKGSLFYSENPAL